MSVKFNLFSIGLNMDASERKKKMFMYFNIYGVGTVQ